MKRKVITAIWIGFLIRVLVAVWNGFWGPSFGAEVDAASFHYWATEFSRQPTLDNLKISSTYSYMLGFVYYLTTDSLFIGSLFSCLAWLASGIILIKIMSLLSIAEHLKFKAMVVYALLPSSILFTSVTIREAYQLLFVNMAIYYSLKVYLNKSALHWMFLLFSVLGMSVLHGALLAFGVFIVGSTLVINALHDQRSFSLIKFLLLGALAILTVIFGLSFSSGIFYTFEDGIAIAVESYQQASLDLDGRTNYKDGVQISGLVGLILFLPLSLFQYLFEPMPWRISSILDLVTLSENIIRALLIWKSWINVKNANLKKQRLLVFILLMYIIVEFIWSVGTINWGTAMRHHLPSIGLLLITAFAYPGYFVSSKKIKLF